MPEHRVQQMFTAPPSEGDSEFWNFVYLAWAQGCAVHADQATRQIRICDNETEHEKASAALLAREAELLQIKVAESKPAPVVTPVAPK